MQPVYNTTCVCPVSARLFGAQLAIPMHANLSDDDLERVAREGTRAFYAGDTARVIAETVEARGGVLDVDDLADELSL